VDGDGWSDLLIGASESDVGGVDAGGALLVYGPVTGSMSLASADFEMYATEDEAWAGYSVAHAGDHDGDGLGDFLIGAYGTNSRGTEAGSAFIVLTGGVP
jgi:hypothetical protein